MIKALLQPVLSQSDSRLELPWGLVPCAYGFKKTEILAECLFPLGERCVSLHAVPFSAGVPRLHCHLNLYVFFVVSFCQPVCRLTSAFPQRRQKKRFVTEHDIKPPQLHCGSHIYKFSISPASPCSYTVLGFMTLMMQILLQDQTPSTVSDQE